MKNKTKEKYLEKKNHYLYKIINTKTNEYYVGVRSCDCNIELDPYMGSSQKWNKKYIKENKNILKKEILNILDSREIADIEEVNLLKSCEKDTLCINILYDKIPNHLGVKQSDEWINKRKMIGEKNGMYGKHHSEESKQKISDSLKNRVLSDEHKEKIKIANQGKIVSKETKLKMAKSKSIYYYIEDLQEEEILKMSLTEYARLKGFNDATGLNYAAHHTGIYKKRYKIYTIEAFESNLNRTLGELLETPEVDNQQPSLGSIKKY